MSNASVDYDDDTRKVAGFNAIFESSGPVESRMHCHDIDSKRQTTAASIKMSPDLALSFSKESTTGGHDVFFQPAVYVEVQSSKKSDIPFQQDQSLLPRSTLSKLPKQLLLQVLRYVHIAQVPELP
ncbi:hypothetical protein PIIN_10708 [Serendipita indica DSM 11827]|uniref:F-box domain-containing protein n=1 Tax=Serendipita indica (strain DSM 11827) TaxID=1109443 RepID=G4TZH7_SERID|nr:hypothetical protein PIIN_10708 [Serendipita indica DSM 11827]